MQIETYNWARNLLQLLTFPFSFLIFFSGLLLFLSTYYPSLKRLVPSLKKLNFLFYLAGFFVLMWFHWIIYQSLPLVDTQGTIVGRFKVPLWIESEKLYFWALFLSLFILFPLSERAEKISLQILFLFNLSVVFLQNPFLFPLPRFHQEISQLLSSSNNIFFYQEVLRSLFYRQIFYYNSTYMWTHPPFLFLAYAALTISFSSAIASFGDSTSEKYSYNWAKVGYLLLTAGIVLGYPWALIAWKNEPWWWSPKINVSLMMWLFYSSYLHLRLYLHRKEFFNFTQSLNIASFVVLMFTYITTYLIPGVHSYG